MPHNWTEEEIRRVGYRVVDLIAEHLATARPIGLSSGAARASGTLSLDAGPAAGESPDGILREFRDTIAPFPFGNGHPRFWGWVNSPPSVMGIFGDALAAA